MHSNVTIKNVSWSQFSWLTLYMPTRLVVGFNQQDLFCNFLSYLPTPIILKAGGL